MKNNTETINWKSADTVTEQSNNKNLSHDIKTLVSNLRINQQDSDFEEDVLQKVLNKHLKLPTPIVPESHSVFAQGNDLGLSESPFISSDIFNHLQKKAFKEQDIHQDGGAKRKKKKQMKDILDDSSTSLTSSEDLSSSDDVSDSDDEGKKHKKHRKEKHHSEKHHRSLKARKETETDNLSYLSSSAHTGGEFTETNKSVTNENEHMGQDSIHTSDINMVSEY